MQEEIPRLDRGRAQCLDLTLANETWKISYRNIPQDSVYVATTRTAKRMLAILWTKQALFVRCSRAANG